MTKGAPSETDRQLARQARLVSVVLAVTVFVWMGAQWMGGKYGWEPRFAFLFDMAAGAAFIWTLFVTYQIWRKRQG